MAHSKKALSRNGTSDLGGTNQTNFYFYSTNHTLAEMIAAGYFNDSRKTVKVNDIVRAVYDKDGTAGFAILRFTAVPSTGNVTVEVESVGVSGFAALTEDSGAIGGTNDGDLPALTGSPAGTDAAIITALIASVRELATRVNALTGG